VIAAAIFRTDLIHGTDALAAMDVWMVIERDPEAVRVAKQRDLDRHGVPAGSAHQDSPPR
jgi:hypothetical protein